MTANPSSSFTDIWKSVVAELNGDLGGTTTLTAQQRAWLRMVQPLVLTEGFALLSVPTQFVQNEIERHLREPIIAALSRHLGQRAQNAPDERTLALFVVPRVEVIRYPQRVKTGFLGSSGLRDQVVGIELFAAEEITDMRHVGLVPGKPGGESR